MLPLRSSLHRFDSPFRLSTFGVLFIFVCVLDMVVGSLEDLNHTNEYAEDVWILRHYRWMIGLNRLVLCTFMSVSN